MISSFNAFGSKADSFGPLHQPIWLGTVKPVPVGGVLASAYRKSGLLIGAGSAIELKGGAISPLIAWEVVSFTAAAGAETLDTIVIKPAVLGKVTFIPAANDLIQKLGASFSSTGKAAVVASCTLIASGDNAGCYEVTVLHSATIDVPSEGDYIVLSAATSAGSDASIKVQPNAYLYNDIYTGELDTDVNASGAAVQYHPEGILIDLTPDAAFAAQMKVAVPGVYQVSV